MTQISVSHSFGFVLTDEQNQQRDIGINGGAPAFPVELQPKEDLHSPGKFRGITILDYFAAAAIPALIRAQEIIGRSDSKRVATDAYDIADAMVVERERNLFSKLSIGTDYAPMPSERKIPTYSPDPDSQKP